MKKKLRIRAGIASVLASLLLVVASTAPSHANGGLAITYWQLAWKDNGHTVNITYAYVTSYGYPLWSDSIVFKCSPEDSGYWDYSAKNHINGTSLTWGGVNSAGTYTVHYSVPYGGNVKDCTQSYSYDLEDGSQITAGNTLRMKWNFTTNFYDPSNDVSPTIRIDVAAPTGSGGGGGGGTPGDCSGGVTVLNGGHLDSCVVIGTYGI